MQFFWNCTAHAVEAWRVRVTGRLLRYQQCAIAARKIVLFSMADKSFPSDSTTPPPVPPPPLAPESVPPFPANDNVMPPRTTAADMASSPGSASLRGTGAGAGFTPSPDKPPAKNRSRVLWAGVAALVLALMLLVAWLIKFVAAERALQQVALAGATQVVAPATVNPAIELPPSSSEPSPPATPVSPEPTAAPSEYLTDDEAPPVAAKQAAPADTAADTSSSRTAVTPSRAQGSTQARTAAPVQRAAKSDTTSATRASNADRQRHEDRTGTFRRCPPLGKDGAVMCRWHICNGAAGKEAACRPYLERRP